MQTLCRQGVDCGLPEMKTICLMKWGLDCSDFCDVCVKAFRTPPTAGVVHPQRPLAGSGTSIGAQGHGSLEPKGKSCSLNRLSKPWLLVIFVYTVTTFVQIPQKSFNSAGSLFWKKSINTPAFAPVVQQWLALRSEILQRHASLLEGRFVRQLLPMQKMTTQVTQAFILMV